MAYVDLMQFLERLDKEGEFIKVETEVDENYEIGAICRKALDLKGPALFFNHIKGHSVPLVTSLFSTRKRYALALDTAQDEVQKEWIRRVSKPIEPLIVNQGPCKENILRGDEIDIIKFPTPVWNELAGVLKRNTQKKVRRKT